LGWVARLTTTVTNASTTKATIAPQKSAARGEAISMVPRE
jgi:hypothetical protein